MSNIKNDQDNLLIKLSPISCDDFGVLCLLQIETDLIVLDFKDVSETDRYMSHNNMSYLKKEIVKLNNVNDFNEDELLISIYPIDMFFTMDIFKKNNEYLFVSFRVPVGIYTNSKIAGYNFGLDFTVKLNSLIDFFEGFILEYDNLINS